MNREEKAQVIEELVEKFNNNTHFYITDASGLKVSEVNEFRKLCYDKGIEYKVFKNTMIKKALERMKSDYQAFTDEGVLKGFSGILFITEDGSMPAKVIKEYRRKKRGKKPLLKGASIDTELYIGEDKLDSLSTLKSREELIGEIIALLQSPAKNVIGALQSAPHTLAGIVKTLAEKED
jgi:large subunit ribosomal protein L10